MRIIDQNSGAAADPCVLLLGYFDGVHIGHRALISEAKALAREGGLCVGVTTFYDGKRGGQIYTFSERCKLFEELGIGFVYAAQFDEAFRATEGEKFLCRVCSALPVRAFVCGEDYTYGRGAACGVRELRAFSAAHGIGLHVLPTVGFGGEKAAATLAKTYLREGDMQRLAALLGGITAGQGRARVIGALQQGGANQHDPGNRQGHQDRQNRQRQAQAPQHRPGAAAFCALSPAHGPKWLPAPARKRAGSPPSAPRQPSSRRRAGLPPGG